EDEKRKPPVAILTHGTWTRVFHSDPNIVGKNIVMNGNPFPVAGVLSPEFFLNGEIIPTVGAIEKMDILVALQLAADAQTRQRGDENYNIMARLKPGVTQQRAQADIDA